MLKCTYSNTCRFVHQACFTPSRWHSKHTYTSALECSSVLALCHVHRASYRRQCFRENICFTVTGALPTSVLQTAPTPAAQNRAELRRANILKGVLKKLVAVSDLHAPVRSVAERISGPVFFAEPMKAACRTQFWNPCSKHWQSPHSCRWWQRHIA